MLAWHFLNSDRKINFGDNRKVRTGVTYRHDGDVVVGTSGLHASTDILEAMKYCKNKTVLCRVELGDAISQQWYHAGQDSKIKELVKQGKKTCYSPTLYAGSSRKVLWMIDVKDLLPKFIYKYANKIFDEIDNPHKEVMRELLNAKQQADSGGITDREHTIIKSRHVNKSIQLELELIDELNKSVPSASPLINAPFMFLTYFNNEVRDEFYEKHRHLLTAISKGLYISDHIQSWLSAIYTIRDLKINGLISNESMMEYDDEYDNLIMEHSVDEDTYIRKSLIGMINASRRVKHGVQ